MVALEIKGRGLILGLQRVLSWKAPFLPHAHEEGTYFTGAFHLLGRAYRVSADLAVVSPPKVLSPEWHFEGYGYSVTNLAVAVNVQFMRRWSTFRSRNHSLRCRWYEVLSLEEARWAPASPQQVLASVDSDLEWSRYTDPLLLLALDCWPWSPSFSLVAKDNNKLAFKNFQFSFS